MDMRSYELHLIDLTDVRLLKCEPEKKHTVDGRNPAPVDMENIQFFIGFYTSQVVSRISSTNSMKHLLVKPLCLVSMVAVPCFMSRFQVVVPKHLGLNLYCTHCFIVFEF